MSTIAATVTGCQLVRAPDGGLGSRYLYELVCSFSTYSASSDNGQITGVATAIGTFTKDGKTYTLRQVMGGGPGISSGGTAVYATTATVATADVTFNLGGVTAEADVAACSGVKVLVLVDAA